MDDLYPDPGDAGPLRTAAQLADAAWLGADRAMARGRAGDAERWMRLHRQFRALAAEEAREVRQQAAKDTDDVIERCKIFTKTAVAGRQETEALIRAMKAGVPLDALDRLDRRVHGPGYERDRPAPPEGAAPTARLDDLHDLHPPTLALSPLKRSLLEAQLNKALRRGDHAAAHRLRAKLASAGVTLSPPPA